MTTVITAPLWRRFAALIYDSLILLAISMAYGAIVTLFGAASKGTSQDYQPMFQTGGAGELVLIGWIISLASFYVGFWYRSGQTVGMRAWRLKLVNFENPKTTPTLIQCTQRAAWGLLSFTLFGFGYWYRFFNQNGQCLHDKLTHSVVIVLPKT